MESKLYPIDDHMPYSDRKFADRDDSSLDIETIVKIQQMACTGTRPAQIYAQFANQGVTMEQIMSLLDPPSERAHAGRVRRQGRANVGFARLERQR